MGWTLRHGLRHLWQTGAVSSPTVDLAGVDRDELVAALRAVGATFALLHGSRVRGTTRPDSDVDVAAWLPVDVQPWDVVGPDRVDLVSLRHLPLALGGRIALEGVLLFDDDPPARVRWQAETRLRFFDESHRRRWITRDVLEAVARG